MFAYGQVKGRRYDNRQTEYVPPTPELTVHERYGGKRMQPVFCDGKRFESVAACAREFDCQPSTIRDHLERGTAFRGHILHWDLEEKNE